MSLRFFLFLVYRMVHVGFGDRMSAHLVCLLSCGGVALVPLSTGVSWKLVHPAFRVVWPAWYGILPSRLRGNCGRGPDVLWGGEVEFRDYVFLACITCVRL